MKLHLTAKEFAKSTIAVLVVAVMITLYYRWLYALWMIGDALFLAGLLGVCIGLFRVVRLLGMFDSTIYGAKRLTGKTKQDFADYLQSNPYTQPFAEQLLVGLVAIGISFVF